MTSTILATSDTVEHANNAIRDLTEAGYNRSDIGLALHDPENRYSPYLEEAVTGSEGAGFGAIIGSLFGAVVGLAAITVPGVGPIIAAGPLGAAIGALAGAGIGAAGGAVTGGITASLVKLGIDEEDAHYYAESLRQGAALVSVTAHEVDADRALRILRSHNPIDIDKRVAQWRARGWDQYDPMVDPFTAEQRAEMEREREFDDEPLTPNEEYEQYEQYEDTARKYPRY